MKLEVSPLENRGYILRLAQESDAEEYYQNNFNPLEDEVLYFTGGKAEFTRDEIVTYLRKCVSAQDRYDFLIISPEGKIIGESIVNEIDWEFKSANFRILMFHAADRGKGIGTWAVEVVRDFAFAQLKLHRLSLDVFSYNTRAEKIYLKAGFKREGVLRDAIMDGENYADDILMAILEEEWRAIKGTT